MARRHQIASSPGRDHRAAECIDHLQQFVLRPRQSHAVADDQHRTLRRFKPLTNRVGGHLDIVPTRQRLHLVGIERRQIVRIANLRRLYVKRDFDEDRPLAAMGGEIHRLFQVVARHARLGHGLGVLGDRLHHADHVELVHAELAQAVAIAMSNHRRLVLRHLTGDDQEWNAVNISAGNPSKSIRAARTSSDMHHSNIIGNPCLAFRCIGCRLLVLHCDDVDAGMMADRIVEVHRPGAADGIDIGASSEVRVVTIATLDDAPAEELSDELRYFHRNPICGGAGLVGKATCPCTNLLSHEFVLVCRQFGPQLRCALKSSLARCRTTSQ